MVALIAVETVVLVLLVVLVFGLLRSHADILKALHDLGAGVGEPAREQGISSLIPARAAEEAGPTAITGRTPTGDAASVSLVGGRDTLVAFLSSGCLTCRTIWEALSREPIVAPGDARVLAVTRGPELESVSAVAEAASGARVPVLMSSEAFDAFGVPGSPYFVYVDGATGRVRGEGTAREWDQVVQLGVRALADEGQRRAGTVRRGPLGRGDRDSVERVDRELAEAGIRPGDPRLHFSPGDGNGTKASS